MFCRNCGAPTDENAQFCIKCGANLQADPAETELPPPPFTPPQASPYAAPVGVVPKQKLVAALLGILLGSLGVHRFYLGYNTIGTVQLVLGLLGILTCGVTTIASAVWGIIDGVLILTGRINTDAQGVPLLD
jgi:TM2 domain-containing membrane protein YozV